jgi:hypothetical protein
VLHCTVRSRLLRSSRAGKRESHVVPEGPSVAYVSGHIAQHSSVVSLMYSMHAFGDPFFAIHGVGCSSFIAELCASTAEEREAGIVWLDFLCHARVLSRSLRWGAAQCVGGLCWDSFPNASCSQPFESSYSRLCYAGR